MDILYLDYQFKKKFGQVFLKDKFIIQKIISMINIKKTDYIIEIGPGFGAMSDFIIKKLTNKLIALEIDEDIILFLLKKKLIKDIKLILTDVMHFDYEYFFLRNLGVLFRFIGNLPYNISVSFLIKLCYFQNHVLDMNFMFQKEVAEKIFAKQGTKKYGRLSVIVQSFFKVTLKLCIKNYYFYPIPKVDSIFLNFVPLKFYENIDFKKYLFVLKYITKISFQNRRKILKNKFSHLNLPNIFIDLNINPLARAEEISVLQYLNFSKYLIKKKKI